MTTLATRQRAGGSSGNSPGAELRKWLGFHPGFIPLIVAVGIVYLMVSLPELFGILARFDPGPAYVHNTFAFLSEQAQRWSARAETISYDALGIWLIRISLFVIPALWLASLIRSAVVRSWRPFIITFLASSFAAIGIPIATWIGETFVVLWRVGDAIMDFIATYIWPWVLRIGFWILVAVVVGTAIVGAYMVVRFLARERRWLAFLAAAGVAALVAGAAWLGWLDWLWAALEWLWAWIAPVLGWIFRILVIALVWVIRIILVALTFVLVVGLAVGFLGEIGRQVFLPLRSATGAGRDRGRCADLAAGIGIAMSLALTAAVLDPGFGATFGHVWRTTPLVSLAPVPIDAYDVLLPSAAEDLLRPAFAGFLPILDIGILVLAAALGVISLLFASSRWDPTSDSRVIRPVLLGVGGAIAFAVLVLFAVLLTGAIADSS